ncbi:hypothetical protein IJJ53_02185 [Candidatus Saccharibacteria bacterium]|nr:hypothetical protein [Candidatus Saccharibacteria bacterium]
MSHKSKTNNYTDLFYHFFCNILLVSLPLLVIVSLALSLPHSSATISSSSDLSSSADHLDFSVLVSCTLVSNVEETHSATLLNGTYKDNIGKTIMTTYCNDSNGYTVYIASPAFNTNNQSILVSSINSDYDIVTGTATSGADSAWAMKLSKSNINTNIDNNGNTITTNNIVTNVGNDSPTIDPAYEDKYVAVPASWTPVVSKASGTVSSQTGASFTTTYAAYTSATQPAGTYTGLVRYLLLHNNQAIPTPAYFMQDVAVWKDSLSLNQSIQAIDERDGKKYWVTKLADGNIWMTQNLDLCIGCEGVAALTSENTDINPEASGKGIYNAAGGYSESGGAWTWTPDNASITSSTKVDYSTNTATGWDSQSTAPRSAEGGDTYLYTSGNNNDDTRYDSLDLCKADHSEADCLHYHVGNYYNWTATIASNNSISISADKVRAENSICPRGWRLPSTDTTDNAYNEFGRLFYNEAYNITNNVAGSGNVGYKTGGFNALRTSPLWFVRSGNLDNGTLYYPAVYGYYWSNTVASGSNAYSLAFNSSVIYPAFSYYRRVGWSVRCIARQEN